MRYDVECPYCGHEHDINHDDGYGYTEDELFEQECPMCEKYYVYETYISISHSARRAECLNDGNHLYKPTCTYPKEFTKMRCSACGTKRKPTDTEMSEILGNG